MERSNIRKYLVEYLSRDLESDRRSFEGISTISDGDDRRCLIGKRVEDKFTKGFGVT